jgi:hypothetical protein
VSRLSTARPAALVAAVALAGVLALAGCAPATGSSGNGSATGSTGGAAGSTGTSGSGSCHEFTSSALSALVNVPVGKPFVAGSDSNGGVICWFGIGKNASVSGSAVETLSNDSLLITTIGVDGQSQYKHFTGSDVNIGAVTPLGGVGDKAAYTVSALTGNAPELYAVHGSLYCGVQLNIGSASELVDKSMAAAAKDEGGLCNEAFAKH